MNKEPGEGNGRQMSVHVANRKSIELTGLGAHDRDD